jgi:hypothetical protein
MVGQLFNRMNGQYSGSTVNDVQLIDALTANWNGNCQVIVEQQLVLFVYWTQRHFSIDQRPFFFFKLKISISSENWLKWVQLSHRWTPHGTHFLLCGSTEER